MSASEPETPKPDNAVDQEVTNALDNLKAENEKLREELAEARSQLAEQNPAPAINLSDKAGEVASYLKSLLCDEKLLNSTLTKIKRNKPVSLPREVISKVEGILSGDDKKPPTDARELLHDG